MLWLGRHICAACLRLTCSLGEVYGFVHTSGRNSVKEWL